MCVSSLTTVVHQLTDGGCLLLFVQEAGIERQCTGRLAATVNQVRLGVDETAVESRLHCSRLQGKLCLVLWPLHEMSHLLHHTQVHEQV